MKRGKPDLFCIIIYWIAAGVAHPRDDKEKYHMHGLSHLAQAPFVIPAKAPFVIPAKAGIGSIKFTMFKHV